MKKITFIAALLISAASFAQIASTSFEEPGVVAIQYVDTGDAATAHDLENNVDEPLVDFTSTGGEMGFNARYEPYDEPGTGLTDGDWVGVTGFTGDVTDFSDGVQGYGIGDADGNFILEFDTVDLTGFTNAYFSVDYYINETGYEGDGTENASGSDRFRIYVRDLTNSTEIDILNTEGSDINDLLIEGAWINGMADLVDGSTVQLVVEARTNSGSETLYLDNVFVDSTLGTNDLDASQFSMFPNPATKGFVNIASQLDGDKTIAVYDVLGKQVINTTIANDRLDISELASGIYIVKISQENSTSTQKLVVK